MTDLSLHPEHLSDLRKSGLLDAIIKSAGVYSLRPDDINKVCGPHFSGKISSVLAFPYPGHDGFLRYKFFPSVQTENGIVKYYQPPKTGNALYFPPGVEGVLEDVTHPFYITEGEKKALKATQEGLSCIGLGGLWNWGDGSEGKKLIPDFNRIALNGRNVFLIPDNDWEQPDKHGEPRNLKQAIYELAYRLIDRGAKVFVVELPPGPEKMGVDDFLTCHFPEEFKSLPTREIRGEIPKGKAPSIDVGTNLTDLGNARRFVTIHGAYLRYCYPWAKWLVWDGKRLKVDDRGEVFRKAKDTVMSIYQEAAKTKDEGERKDLAKHGLRSEAESRVEAMIGMAKSEPGIPVLPDEIDKNPWVLNVANGTLDLKTGTLKPHRPEDLITKLSPIEYRPEVACPFWLEHLSKIFQGNVGLISFLQVALGYSLTGITDERAMLICYGKGWNGKTTTVEIFADILGDYAARTPTESILIKRESAIPNDLAALKGARFVYCSETEEGKRLAESLIKDLTGGDKISARFMRGEWFSFRPEFKLWLSTNHRPVIRGTDDAIWARLRLIPFNFQFPEEERIPRSIIWEKITPELPGILAWAVQGLKDWRQFGLFQPDEVKEATQGYRAEMDILGKFLEERCYIKKRAEAAAKELYSAYSKWCEENGERGVSQRVFSVRLIEKGFKNQRTRAGYVWLGIGLNEGETREPREPREPILTIIREN